METFKNIVWGLLRTYPASWPFPRYKASSFLSRFTPRARLEPRTAGNGFYVTGDTNNISFLLGFHELPYLQLLSENIEEGATVIDIGANVGYNALWLAHALKLREVKVIAVEPEEENYAWLLKNLQLNDDLPISPVQTALGDFIGTLKFKTHGRGDGSARAVGSRETSNPDGMVVTEVSCTTLDALVQQRAGSPNWLILDVEGYAGAVLRGGSQCLAACRPKIAVEIHGEGELEEVEKCLLLMGYERWYDLQSHWGRHVLWRVSI